MHKYLKFGLIGLVICTGLFFLLGKKYWKSNTSNTVKVYWQIPTNTNYDQLLQVIKNSNALTDYESFVSVANSSNLQNNIKPGRYEITPGMTNYKLVKMLKSGNQKAVKLVLKKYRLKQDLARHISNKLEADSNSVMQILNNNTYWNTLGLDSLSSIAAFTPNTYEFYWNTDAKTIADKISKQYTKVWHDGAKQKAAALNLTPAQVMTLASIVDEETEQDSEKGNVASVYLNRIKKGMKLQADPTVKYAVGDFAIKRVLLKHLTTPSPYNTYVVPGLPIGPICTPRQASVDAVLNAPSTNYIFFCASPDKIGFHNFASTDAEHLANAKKFQEWLDKRGIKK